MTYEETTDYLFTRTTSFERQGSPGYKEGLQTTLTLDEHFGHPHQFFKSIHIAGTNGKGSVSHCIAAMLQVKGYRVGLYTSPHLLDFRERIRVNGDPIPTEYVTHFVESEKEFFEPLKPSFFELTTAMAFKYFREQQVDIAVIEVGLGGRLDCTNIITPIVSVITNISLDHTDLLGPTIKHIAREKAGIMKENVPCVIGEATADTREVFDATAQETGTPLVYSEDHPYLATAEPLSDGTGYQYSTTDGVHFKSELAGNYQIKNTNTILCVFHELEKQGVLPEKDGNNSRQLLEEDLNRAFQHVCELTGLMGRWQKTGEHPTVVCDTGHNPGGWEYLSKQLAQVKCRQLRIVFGMVSDKDVSGVLQMMPRNAIYYFTKASTKRALPESVLKNLASQFGLEGECYPTVKEAFAQAKSASDAQDFIFVGGSTYVVSEYMITRD